MLDPQKLVPACYFQTVFVLAYHLAEVPVTFAVCKRTIINSCVGPCALLLGSNCSSLATVWMNFIGGRPKVYLTHLMFFSDVLGCPVLNVSNTDPRSIKFLCHQQIEGQYGEFLTYFCSFTESEHLILFQ